MKLRFHCDYCDKAHETADACGKCERACEQVPHPVGCAGCATTEGDTSYCVAGCDDCGENVSCCLPCADNIEKAARLIRAFKRQHKCPSPGASASM